MGAKYFPEVGYEQLYDCATVADSENGRAREVARADAHRPAHQRHQKVDEIVAHPERCKEPSRPSAGRDFKQDIAFFRSRVGDKRWEEIHHDHGYNATPVWTLLGYALTNTGGPRR